MDTSLARATDRLGRPTGPRRKHTVSEKLRMVEETGRPGASVAEVARRRGINANLLFGWRRLVRHGLLRSESAAPSLLPVRVETPTLTPRERIAFGRAVVREMERVGMVVCCTHTGRRTALDVLDYAERPVIFSHSNPRSFVDHPRNIDDELIRNCAATGGVIGINGVGLFLGGNDISPNNLVRHIDHVVQTVGPGHVGLGLDFVYDMEEILQYVRDHPEQFPARLGYSDGVKFAPLETLEGLVDALFRKGCKTEHVRGILGGNFLRLARQVWR